MATLKTKTQCVTGQYLTSEKGQISLDKKLLTGQFFIFPTMFYHTYNFRAPTYSVIMAGYFLRAKLYLAIMALDIYLLIILSWYDYNLTENKMPCI